MKTEGIIYRNRPMQFFSILIKCIYDHSAARSLSVRIYQEQSSFCITFRRPKNPDKDPYDRETKVSRLLSLNT